MSRNNKVNPDHYTMAGRLAPDELARQRRQQDEQLFGRGRRRQRTVPPWLASETAHNRVANAPAAAPKEEQTHELDGKGAPTARRRTRPALAKATGATPKTRKARSAKGSAVRRSSPQKAAKPAARKGRTTGTGTRQKKKTGGRKVSPRAAPTKRKR